MPGGFAAVIDGFFVVCRPRGEFWGLLLVVAAGVGVIDRSFESVSGSNDTEVRFIMR